MYPIIDTWVMVNLDTGAWLARFLQGATSMLQNKYISYGPHSFRQEFLNFTISNLWELSDPGLWPIWTLGSRLADLSREPLDIVANKTYKLWASWFQRKCFFPL